MKADLSAQQRLADIAELDASLGRLAHRRSTLPEQADLDALRAERGAAAVSAARVSITVEDVDRAIAKLESDISAVRQRRAKDEALVAGGTLPARQITELDHELGTLARRQDELEGQELELMEHREALAADLDHSGAHISSLDDRVAEATRSRDNVLADVENAANAALAERERVAALIPSELLDLYARISAESGVGAGIFTGGRCTACAMELDRRSISVISAAAEDDVVQCPECRAILIRGARTR